MGRIQICFPSLCLIAQKVSTKIRDYSNCTSYLSGSRTRTHQSLYFSRMEEEQMMKFYSMEAKRHADWDDGQVNTYIDQQHRA